jgi:hypothetical protein
VKRSLSGLVVALSLFACAEEERGKLEPIPRPPGMEATPKAEAPAEPAKPAVDPSKVVLRWKLGAGTPVTYRLDLERTGGASAPVEAAPEKPTRGRKGRGKAKETPPPAAPAPTAAAAPKAYTFVMERTDTGDYRLRVTPEGTSANADIGTLSERGFVLDGLQGATRNAAMLVFELPRDPVGPNDTWSLATELMASDGFGTQFQTDKSERRNRVKLASIADGEGGEKVATLEYDLYERVDGKLRQPTPKGPVPARANVEEATGQQAPVRESEAGAEVRITGRGEFLVNAGRWRSWEGTLSSYTKGFPATVVQVPPGSLKLRLTALESARPPAPTAQQPQQ